MKRCFFESLDHGGIMIIEEDGDVDVYDAVAGWCWWYEDDLKQ